MTWLTWRQFRVQALTVAVALAAATVLLVSVRPALDHDDGPLFYGGMLAVYALPAIIGAFWGVPLVARELEAGTHNVAWNQTVTRTRWLAVKLAIPGVAAVVAAALLSVVVTWWASPIDALAETSSDPDTPTRLQPALFAARGIVPIGYAAFAFVLGVLLGILLRRVLAAMAVALAVFAAVLVAMPFLVRPYLLPPTDETVAITADNIRSIHVDSAGAPGEGVVTVDAPNGAWVVTNETVDGNGTVPDLLPQEVAECAPGPPVDDGPPPRLGDARECFAQLADLGYRQHLVYQPASRFWPLQWLETALFLALTALLTWLCFRSIRRLS